MSSHNNGTILSKEDFTDNVRYRNGFEPNNLSRYCDGYGAVITTEHGLHCKHGRLVHEQHHATADT